MNRHREIQLSASIPHGIETRVVNLHERSRRDVLAQIKSESFEDFQAARAVAVRLLNRLRLQLRDSSVL